MCSGVLSKTDLISTIELLLLNFLKKQAQQSRSRDTNLETSQKNKQPKLARDQQVACATSHPCKTDGQETHLEGFNLSLYLANARARDSSTALLNHLLFQLSLLAYQ